MSTTPVRRTGAEYVEVGAALLAAAADGEVGLAATIVGPAALILGSAQPDADAATAIDVVKRTDAYRPLGEAIQSALAGLGVDCRTVTVDEARGMDDARKAAARRACWAGLSPYELVLGDGRKLVGLAQRRRRRAVLHQIAIPVTTPPAAVADHLVDGAALAPWLAATAMLAGAAGCGSATPDGVWDVLRGPLTALLG